MSQASPIFLLSAPRTGSTFVFQTIIDHYKLPYINNLANKYFPTFPELGVFAHRLIKPKILKTSSFGKTHGLMQPSEASHVMRKWFSSGHPSQLKSNKVNLRMKKRAQTSARFSQALFNGRPLIVKNTWNCYRIESVIELFPQARFIWLKRNLLETAVSDLEARYATSGDPTKWNSATPATVNDLKKYSPAVQVIENQYEIAKAVKSSLSGIDRDQWVEVWYEDILKDEKILADKLSTIGLSAKGWKTNPEEEKRISDPRYISANEILEIKIYIRKNSNRLSSLQY